MLYSAVTQPESEFSNHLGNLSEIETVINTFVFPDSYSTDVFLELIKFFVTLTSLIFRATTFLFSNYYLA